MIEINSNNLSREQIEWASQMAKTYFRRGPMLPDLTADDFAQIALLDLVQASDGSSKFKSWKHFAIGHIKWLVRQHSYSSMVTPGDLNDPNSMISKRMTAFKEGKTKAYPNIRSHQKQLPQLIMSEQEYDELMVSERLGIVYTEPTREAIEIPKDFTSLSEKERLLITLITEGFSLFEIAKDTELSKSFGLKSENQANRTIQLRQQYRKMINKLREIEV